MIIVKLKGGLGNQLFQYAFGRKLAIQNNSELKLDIGESPEAFHKNTARKFKLDRFNICASIASQEELNQIKNPYGLLSKVLRAFRFWILKKYNIDFEQEQLYVKAPAYLDGFWQTEKYFLDIRPLLLDELTLKDRLSEASKHINEMIKTSHSSASLHVRRGDYISDSKTHKVHGSICTPSYYKEAITALVNHVPLLTFYVFSDDIEWAKNNLPVPREAVFVSNEGIQDYEELILMSLCKHHIIANSSFSWWGAWLNNNPDKIVIAPKKWVNKVPDPHPNIVPDNWIRI